MSVASHWHETNIGWETASWDEPPATSSSSLTLTPQDIPDVEEHPFTKSFLPQIIANMGRTEVSEGADARVMDIINYAVFALIKAGS